MLRCWLDADTIIDLRCIGGGEDRLAAIATTLSWRWTCLSPYGRTSARDFKLSTRRQSMLDEGPSNSTNGLYASDAG